MKPRQPWAPHRQQASPAAPRGWLLFLVLAVLAAAAGSGCQRSPSTSQGAQIATTTSYLEAVARDLLGEDLRVLRLAEPGTCPGHFDMRPSQVAALRGCHMLLRFDFQRSLDARFVSDRANGPSVAEVSVRGGMCRPESYLSACRQTAEHLVALGQLPRTQAETRLSAIAARLEDLSRETTNRVARAGLIGLPVIASGHQRDFCEWLGLKVVADFRAADMAGISEIEAAINAGQLAQIRLVVANLPEGRRTADALAERLQARVVVFENFPAQRDGAISFDAMVRSNAGALLQPVAP